jgi:ribose-phosphate pyrophosphokinase
VSSMQIIGNVKDKNVIIVDDIVDTGGTLAKAADYIMECGASSVRAAITHPLLSGIAQQKIADSQLVELLVTDTINQPELIDKIKVLSIAPIFGMALRKIYEQASVSSLFIR